MSIDLSRYSYEGPIPKPVFNDNFYTGSDLYSDGDVEDTIINIIASEPTTDYSDAIVNNFSWPVYYHLTHTRANILNWYPFAPDSSVLEIGCGMGAITETLCKSCKKVTAVELSKKRATATYLRCREYDNLEIIVGNLNDIDFSEKYDYITLIGVLEYQLTYTSSQNPYVDFLRKIKSLLKPNGKLLIAIENKYGLKYWCGAYEDHTSIPFDGINGYKYSTVGVRTFSKSQLSSMIKESGFANAKFYYPLPDYKFPSCIYSEDRLPNKYELTNLITYYSPNNNTLIADERNLYNDIIENNAFEFMANSFFVECCANECTSKDVLYSIITTERCPEYNVITTIKNNYVTKKGAAYSSNHISQAYNNLLDIQSHGLKILPCLLQDDTIKTEYSKLPLLSDLVYKAYKNSDIETIYGIYDKLYTQILQSSETTNENSLLLDLDIIQSDEILNSPILKKGYIDLIARNCFVDENNDYLWIDQEWMLDNIPADFILYHNFDELYKSYPFFNEVLSKEELLIHYKLDKTVKYYDYLWKQFYSTIINSNYILARNQYALANPANIITAISKILKK